MSSRTWKRNLIAFVGAPVKGAGREGGRVARGSRDYTSDSARRRGTSSLPMPLELESYLNVPRISEIELFLRCSRPGFTYVISWDGRAAVHRMQRYSVADAPRPFLVLRDVVTSRVWRNFPRLPPPAYHRTNDSRDVSSIYDRNTRCGGRFTERMKR